MRLLLSLYEARHRCLQALHRQKRPRAPTPSPRWRPGDGAELRCAPLLPCALPLASATVGVQRYSSNFPTVRPSRTTAQAPRGAHELALPSHRRHRRDPTGRTRPPPQASSPAPELPRRRQRNWNRRQRRANRQCPCESWMHCVVHLAGRRRPRRYWRASTALPVHECPSQSPQL